MAPSTIAEKAAPAFSRSHLSGLFKGLTQSWIPDMSTSQRHHCNLPQRVLLVLRIVLPLVHNIPNMLSLFNNGHDCSRSMIDDPRHERVK